MPKKGQAKLTVEQLEHGLEEYFQLCKETKVTAVIGKQLVEISKPPMIQGILLHLGIDDNTWYKYADGDYPVDPQSLKEGETVESIQKYVKDIIGCARQRIIVDAYEGATLGIYKEQTTQNRLSRMGEKPNVELNNTGSFKLEWANVSPSQADAYSK